MSIKIGYIGDLHYSDAADSLWGGPGPLEYRRRSTADTRFAEAISTFNTAGCDFMIDIGDKLDGGTTDLASYIASYVSRRDTFNGDVYDGLGNHERGLYGWDSADYSNLWTVINPGHAARSNQWPSAEDPRAYSFDRDGFRFIVLYYNYIDSIGSGSGSQLEWLQGRLNPTESSLPVVIFSHAHVRDMGTGYSYAHGPSGDLSAIQSAIEANGNVQAVIGGHYHHAKVFEYVNDIPYICLGGSVLAWEPDDNTYYIIEITPDVYVGKYQKRAGIVITGYGLGRSMDLTQFAPLVA